MLGFGDRLQKRALKDMEERVRRGVSEEKDGNRESETRSSPDDVSAEEVVEIALEVRRDTVEIRSRYGRDTV